MVAIQEFETGSQSDGTARMAAGSIVGLREELRACVGGKVGYLTASARFISELYSEVAVDSPTQAKVVVSRASSARLTAKAKKADKAAKTVEKEAAKVAAKAAKAQLVLER